MWPAYLDIRNRAGAPGWHSPGGVPRYCDFHPRKCGVYAQYVALLRVACQCCGHQMIVASECDMFDAVSHPDHMPKREGCSDPWEAVGWFEYGDAPYHGCHAGETMNAVPLEILQFWRHEFGEDGFSQGWKRDATYEFVLPPLKSEGL